MVQSTHLCNFQCPHPIEHILDQHQASLWILGRSPDRRILRPSVLVLNQLWTSFRQFMTNYKSWRPKPRPIVRPCKLNWCVRGHVRWSGRVKSSQISGLGFRACQNLDFGVWVGLGKCIKTMPLSSPNIPDFGFQVLRKLLSGVSGWT